MCCFWENIKKKAALKSIAAHLNASFYLFAFVLFTFCIFFSRLLQGAALVHLPADIEHLCEKDIQEETYVEIPSEKQRETDGVDKRDKIERLCRQDSPKRRLIDKLDQIERMTDEKFKAVFDAFRRTTGVSQRHSDEQERLRGKVQKRFNAHEEFIRTNVWI